jgi:hypothetical protein
MPGGMGIKQGIPLLRGAIEAVRKFVKEATGEDQQSS